MNRKKINSIIAVMSTVLTVNLGGTINVQAFEADKDVPSLHEHQTPDKEDVLDSDKNSENFEQEISTNESTEDTDVEEVQNESSEEKQDTKENAVDEEADNTQAESSKVSNNTETNQVEDKADNIQAEQDPININTNDDSIVDADDSEEEEEEEEEEEVGAYGARLTRTQAVKNINSGNSTVEDYEKIDIAVTEKNKYFYDTAVAQYKKEKKLDSLDEDQIFAVCKKASKVWKFMKDALCVDPEDYSAEVYEEYEFNEIDSDKNYMVDETNVADITKVLADKYLDEDGNPIYTDKDTILQSIENIFEALDKINLGSASEKNYSDVGISGVTESNYIQINKAVKKEKDNVGSKLTVAQINTVVKAELAKIKAISKINNGEATIDDFDIIGISEIRQEVIDKLNENFKKTPGTLSSKEDVEAEISKVNEYLKHLDRLYTGAATKADFEQEGIEGVTEANISKINDNIRYKACSTIDQVKESVKETLIKISAELIKKVTLGKAEYQDYISMGIRGVTEANLVFINSKVKGTEYSTAEDVQKAVSNALIRYDAITRINSGKAEKSDYEAIDIKVVTDENVDFVNSLLNGNSDYIESNIADKVNQALDSLSVFGRINQGKATIEDFNSLGIELSDQQVIDANEILLGKGCKTAEEVQNILTPAFVEKYAIKNINSGKAELVSYKDLGIDGVTTKNKDFINKSMAGRNIWIKESVVKEVTHLIDVFNAITNINAAKGEAKDFKLIEVEVVNNDNMSFVNEYVKGQLQYSVEQAQTCVKNAVQVYNTIQKVNTKQAVFDDYRFLNITRVSATNVDFINSKIGDSTFKTTKDIQDFVDKVLEVEDSKGSINQGTAKMDDYKAVGIQGITSKNYEFVNKYIKGNDYKDVVEIQKAVDEALAIYAEVLLINNGEGELKHYKDIKAPDVTSDNIAYINDYVKRDPYYGLDDLRVQIKKAIEEYGKVQNIKKGAGSVDDYRSIEVYSVTNSNVDFVNSYIETNSAELILQENETPTQIKEKIEKLAKLANEEFTAFDRMNKGQANVDDYINYIGTDAVTEENRAYVNYCLKGLELKDPDDIKRAINDAVSEFRTIQIIREGKGLIEDFIKVYKKVDSELKCPVNVDNVKFINALISKMESSTPSGIQKFVDECLQKFDIVKKIDSGKAVVKDYDDLGLSGVIKDNLNYINQYMEKHNYTTLQEVRERFSNVQTLYKSIVALREGQATLTDYSNLDIVGVTEKNIGFINSQVKNKNLNDEVDAENAVKEAIKVYEAVQRINVGAGAVADYELIDQTIGLISSDSLHVTTDNIKFVNGALKGSDFTSLTVLRESEETAIRKYNAILKVNEGTALVDEYKLLGVTNISKTYLDYVNERMAGVPARNAVNGIIDYNILNVVVTKANSYIDECSTLNKSIRIIRQGQGQLEDYSNLDISEVTQKNIDFINSQIKNTVLVDKDAIKAAVIDAVKVYDALQRINGGTAFVEDYELIDKAILAAGGKPVFNATADNVKFLNGALRGHNFTSLVALGDSEQEAVKKYEAILNVDEGTASVEDYKLLGVSNISKASLDYVNSKLKGLPRKHADNGIVDYTVLEIVKTESNYYAEAFAILNRINEGTATEEDYSYIDIKVINSDNIHFVGQNLKGLKLFQIEDVNKTAAVYADQYTSVAKINDGEATLTNYTTLKITGVDRNNLIYVNADLKNTDSLSIESIQERITANLGIYNALKNINEGTASLDDYKTIGSSSITQDKVDLVNEYSKNQKLLTAMEAVRNTERTLANGGIYAKINEGRATAAEYATVGAINVDEDNVDYINAQIKSTLDPYGRTLQDKIDKILILYTSSKAINKHAEKKADDGNYVYQYKDINGSIIPFDLSEGSVFRTIQKCVELKQKIVGRDLNKSEIVDILEKVKSYPDDAKYVVKEIVKKLQNAEKNNGNKLTGKMIEDNINDLITYIKEMALRVSTGYGNVEDFEFLGRNEVVDDNIDVINTDIKKHSTIQTVGDFRLIGVENAVKIGKSITSINDHVATLADYSNIGYKSMGAYTNTNSLFDLTNRALDLQREVNGNRYLTRDEILETIEKINKSKDDAIAILGTIRNEVDKVKQSNSLSPEAEEKLINSIIDERKAVILRIAGGTGTLEDYDYLGEKLKVNEDNIKVINKDIEENNTVTKLGHLRVKDLSSAIDQGIAIYDINNGKENAVSNNFKILGINNVSLNSTNRARACKLIEYYVELQKKMDNVDYLTRKKLVSIANEVVNNLDNQEIILSQINEIINTKEANGEVLTADQTTEMFNSLKDNRKQVCYNIVNGVAQISDYEYLGIDKVKKETIDVVNTDIKQNKTVILNGEYKLEGLDNAIEQGLAVYYINNNSDKTVEEKFKSIGLTVPYSPEDDSLFNLIQVKIKLERRKVNNRYLTRQELTKCVNEVANNLKDMQVLLPNINEKLDSQERLDGKVLSPEDTEKLMAKETDARYQACQRIAAGNGKLEDYKYLNEDRVTEANIEVINKDIQATKKISISSNYRLDGLEDAVSRGLAIYSINNNNDKSVETCFKTAFDFDIPYDTKETSLFNLIISQIKINRLLNKNNYLVRSELMTLINELKDNETNRKDQEVIIPKVNDAINEKQKEKQKEGQGAITAEEVTSIINQVKEKLKEVCNQVVKGEGTAADFNYLGQTKVTDKNLAVVNYDIKAHSAIALITNYRIGGLEDAVNHGLAVYTINNNKDMTLVDLFDSLGIKVEYSTSETSDFYLITSQIEIQRKINNGNPLSRKEIQKIAEDLSVKDNLEDQKIIIPRVMKEIKAKEKKLERELTPEEVESTINEVKQYISTVCNKVVQGEGTAEDYNYLGETRVTKDNIDIINNDIKNDDKKELGLTTSYRISGLSEAVRKGLAVYSINKNNDKTVVDDFKVLGKTVLYDSNETSEFGILCSKIRLKRLVEKGAFLDRSTILSIIADVEANYEDLKVSMPEINSKVTELENSNNGQPLTEEQISQISELVNNGTKEICQRVYKGQGKLEDFKALGEIRVTAENIDVINNDIKKNGTVTLLSSYRLKGLKEAVDLGLAVFKINNNDNDDSTAVEFNKIGIDVKPEETADGSLSKLKVLEAEVRLKRMTEGNRYLDREEIKNIAIDVENNLDDKKVIISKINAELVDKQDTQLTSEQTTELIKSVKDNIKNVCERISVGKGTVADFKYVGETRVNDENRIAVNKDIEEKHSVSILSNYTLSGLEKAVSDGLSIYAINTATENSAIKDFAAIDINLEYSTDEKSLFKLMQTAIKLKRRVKDNAFLTRVEIQTIRDQLVDHLDDEAVVIPAINDALKKAEKDGTILTSAQVSDLIAKTQNECKQRIKRMCAGEATVDDFVALGEKRITDKIIDIANAEIKEYRTITSATEYRLNDITSAMDEILAIYYINCGFETKAFDTVEIKNRYGDVLRKYDTNFRVKEYEVFGERVAWDDSENSELISIREAIKIMRMLKEGKYLTRNEILNTIVSQVKGNPEAARTITHRIYNALNDAHTVKGKDLTKDEVQAVIDQENSKMKSVVDRITTGMATFDDYNYVGQIKVTKDNVEAINTDVKLYNTIIRTTDVQLGNLTEGVDLGLAVYHINNVSGLKSANDFALIGRNDIKYDENADSIFKLILNYISIERDIKGGALLNRNEILNAIDIVTANQDDFIKVLPKVRSALDESRLNHPTNFTAQNAQNIKDDIESKIKTAVNNVYLGKASVEDYVCLGETRVNSKNYEAVNNDIKKYSSLVILSDYRLGNLEEQVTKALAIYNINHNNVIADENNNAKEYAIFGRKTPYSYDATSAFRLAQKYVSIKQKENGYKDLDRQATLDTIDEVIGYPAQYEYLVPMIADKIFEKEETAENGKVSAVEIENIISNIEETLNKAVLRLVNGNGTIDDFGLFGESTRVNRRNYKYINDDIKLMKEVKETSNYSVSGLEETVSKALAAYNLNNGKETKDSEGNIKEFKTLGIDIAFSTEQTSLYQLLKSAIKIAIRENDNKLISRSKIVEMVDEIRDNYKVAAVKIPKILAKIYAEDESEDTPIGGDRVADIINEITELP